MANSALLRGVLQRGTICSLSFTISDHKVFKPGRLPVQYCFSKAGKRIFGGWSHFHDQSICPIHFSCKAFNPKFELHDIWASDATSVTTRWTMAMEFTAAKGLPLIRDVFRPTITFTGLGRGRTGGSRRSGGSHSDYHRRIITLQLHLLLHALQAPPPMSSTRTPEGSTATLMCGTR